MKDHPLTPMRDSNLMRLLAPQVSNPVGLVNRSVVAAGAEGIRARLAELQSRGTTHVVVDAVANEDLFAIAEACRDMPLLTGGSALAMPLPMLWLKEGLFQKQTASAANGTNKAPSIILSGSCSTMTTRQVSAFLRTGEPAFKIDPVSLVNQGHGPVLEWLARQPSNTVPLIYATDHPDAVRAAQLKLGAAQAGDVVEQALASCAVAARDTGRRNFVVAGGETSGAVAKALHITQLDVGSEIAPGVPWCFAQSAGHDIAITLKSGNFGGETFFTDALERLHH